MYVYIHMYSNLKFIYQSEISKPEKSKSNFLLFICNFNLEIKILLFNLEFLKMKFVLI